MKDVVTTHLPRALVETQTQKLGHILIGIMYLGGIDAVMTAQIKAMDMVRDHLKKEPTKTSDWII